ncbi:indolepyruvate oxidoreductase subunit beta [archaeon BMS3Bbin15]|nr:indolepyruvate oxidoreductase subunit beta [archaeon BMS3Bbin15]
MIKNILIAGVGGQGILFITNILGKAAIAQNLNVRASETHGMAQRGGSVVSHVRIGSARAPLIPQGEADYLVALEPVEALRYLSYISKKCRALVSTFRIVPSAAQSGIGIYPPLEGILENLMRYAEVFPVDAYSLAKTAGNPLTGNTVMLGALSTMEDFPLKQDVLKETLLSQVSPETADINLRAFELGRKAVKK